MLHYSGPVESVHVYDQNYTLPVPERLLPDSINNVLGLAYFYRKQARKKTNPSTPFTESIAYEWYPFDRWPILNVRSQTQWDQIHDTKVGHTVGR